MKYEIEAKVPVQLLSIGKIMRAGEKVTVDKKTAEMERDEKLGMIRVSVFEENISPQPASKTPKAVKSPVVEKKEEKKGGE